MYNYSIKRLSVKSALLVSLIGTTFLSPVAFAQQAAQMSFSELIAQAEYSISNNEPGNAIPLLKEIITRASVLDDKDAQKSVQMARLQLGNAYSQLQRWDESAKYTQEYLAGEPVDDRTAAYQILCQTALAQSDWDKLYEFANHMLSDKNLALRDKETAQKFMVQALFNRENYAEALKMLPDVIAKAKEPNNIRAFRIMQLRCMFETGQTDQLIANLPMLFRGETRDDVTLNLTLLRMGDQLFDRQQYRKALAIYRLVLPKAELLSRQQARLEKANAGENGKKWDITELKQALESLQEVPDYDIHIAYRAAQIYSEHKRYWEAVVLFDQIYRNHPEREEGQASFFQKLLLLYEIGADKEAIAESTRYLEQNKKGLYPRLICTRLAQYYLERQKLDEALALSKYADSWVKTTDRDELAQETDLRYMFSFALFQKGDYEKASQAFDVVIQTDPNSQAAIDSNYWKAMCQLLQQNYELAYRQFIQYRDKWPRASFAPAALFRAGVCRFGLEDYEGAKQIFKTFIEDYSNDALMPEALTMYGDLLGADGQIDEALALYDRAVKIVADNYAKVDDPLMKSQIPAPATYATFQAAQALQADAESFMSQDEEERAKERYRELIHRTKQYMKTFGTDADWAQSVFWIGKAEIQLGETQKAVDAYLNAVIQYGADPAQEGVASILFDLADIIRKRLDDEQRTQTLQSIRKARSAAKSVTLQIRLDVLLAELENTYEELGNQLAARSKDLSVIPPSGLSLICNALISKNDYSRSEELFNQFAENYESSPFMVSAYQLRAEDLYQQKKLDEALELATSALGLYGATADTGWAQLMKGNVELLNGEYKKAVETYNMIFSVRAWRGPISAEAMFRMADAWDKQGNTDKAFAFFQRTYLLYKAYDGGRWAAEAYLRSAECLNKLGRESAARNTYRAMLLDEYVRDLPQAKVAKDTLGPEETAELLAGGTNTMETIEIEVTP